jgi:hypothetical protein
MHQRRLQLEVFSYSSGHISDFISLVIPAYDIIEQSLTWIFAIAATAFGNISLTIVIAC